MMIRHFIIPLVIIISLAAQANSQLFQCLLQTSSCKSVCSPSYSTTSFCTITTYFLFFIPVQTKCPCSWYGTTVNNSKIGGDLTIKTSKTKLTSTSTSTSTSTLTPVLKTKTVKSISIVKVKRQAPGTLVDSTNTTNSYNGAILNFNTNSKTAMISLDQSIENGSLQSKIIFVPYSRKPLIQFLKAKKFANILKKRAGLYYNETVESVQNRIKTLMSSKKGLLKLANIILTKSASSSNDTLTSISEEIMNSTTSEVFTKITSDTSNDPLISTTPNEIMDITSNEASQKESSNVLVNTSNDTLNNTSTTPSEVMDITLSKAFNNPLNDTSELSNVLASLSNDTLSSVSTDILASLSISSPFFVNGLIDYWAFNGNAYDLITGLTLSGSFEYGTDRIGTSNSAIYFNDSYAIIPNCDCANSSVSSIAFWILVSNALDAQIIFDINGLSLRIVNGQLIFFDTVLNVKLPFVDSNKNTFSSKWTHLAITFDGESANLYVNGDMAHFVSWNGSSCLSSVQDECTFGSNADSLLLNAYVDEVLFYKRVLSGDEVQGVMEIST